jgi:hypothetical protein
MSNIKERKFLSFTSHTLFLDHFYLSCFEFQTAKPSVAVTHHSYPGPTHGVVRVRVYSSPFTFIIPTTIAHGINPVL